MPAHQYKSPERQPRLSGNELNVCILARKRLYRNTRVVRQAKALSEAGHNVTVIAIELPALELRAMTPKVTYIRVNLEPWPEKVLRTCVGIFSMLRRAVSKLFRPIGRFLYKICTLVDLECVFGLKSVVRNDGRKTVGFIFPLLMILPITIVRTWRILFELLQRGKDHIYSYLRKSIMPFMNQSRNVSFAAKGVAALNGQYYDYCQAHDTYALLAASRVAQKTGARLIYDALEVPDDRSGAAFDQMPRWLRRWEKRSEQRIVQSADKVLAIGPGLGQRTAEYYGIQAPVVVRNCSLYVEPEPTGEIRRDLGLREGEKVGVVVGSIYRDQGLEQLIECVKDFLPGIHVVALGPEVQPGFVAQLEELSKKKGADGRFHILPPQPPSSLISYLSGADIGIIARQNTCLNNMLSLPNKVFELIMARLPIASSRLPDIEALVKEYGIGLIFDETDPKHIAMTINAMFEQESYTCFKAASHEAAKELCWEKEAQKYVKTIEGRLEEDE